MKRRTITITLALWLLAVLSACRMAAAPAATATPPATPATLEATLPAPTSLLPSTATPTEPVASPTAPSASPTQQTPSPEPPTATPAEVIVTPGQLSPGNPFRTILGPVTLPEEWQVEPCEGDAPQLCVSRSGETVGAVELLAIPLETHPDFQAILREQGLTPGDPLGSDEEDIATIRAALEDLANDYLEIIEADRQLTYAPGMNFVPMPIEPVHVGALPGLALGFTSETTEGEVTERYISYTAFDGQTIYWITAPYDPANITTFTSDADLVDFAPHLREIVAELQLPPG